MNMIQQQVDRERLISERNTKRLEKERAISDGDQEDQEPDGKQFETRGDNDAKPNPPATDALTTAIFELNDA